MPLSTYASAVMALVAIVAMLLLLRAGALCTPFGRRQLARSDALHVEASIPIDGNRRRVSLIRVKGRALLVMTGGPNDLCLGWLDQPAPGQIQGQQS